MKISKKLQGGKSKNHLTFLLDLGNRKGKSHVETQTGSCLGVKAITSLLQ